MIANKMPATASCFHASRSTQAFLFATVHTAFLTKQVLLHVRLSHDQIAGDLLERQALHQRHFQGSMHTRMADEIMLPRRRANKSRWSCCSIFPTVRAVSGLWRPDRGKGKGRWGSQSNLTGWVFYIRRM